MTSLDALVFYSFSIIWFINCGYYIYLGRFSLAKKNSLLDSNSSLEGISVIICAKNEARNLSPLLTTLLKQDYSLFEIIVINDHSTDKSLEILLNFSAENSKIHIINLQNQTGKKAGIAEGIKIAKFNQIFFTDADCLPISNQWISSMAAKFSKEKEIVLGYGGYFKVPNSLLNKLIRFETLFTALQYFAYAKNQNAYMGVGRNLGYTRKLYEAGNGFEKHKTITAGDDDLFVNQNATNTNVAINTDPKSFTYSEPKKTWKSWLIQKRRHVGVSGAYRLKHQLQLGVFYSSQFLFFGLGFWLIASRQALIPVLLLFSIREILVLLVSSKAAAKLKEKDLIPVLLLLEPVLISMQMLIFILNTLVKPRRWN